MTTIGDTVPFARGAVSRNRCVLAAMTNRQSCADGTLSDDELRFLVMRAAGGFGIVTTACAHVSSDGQGFPGELGIFHDRHVPQLAKLANGLRTAGALSLIQMFHAGLRAPEELTGVQPLAPSAQSCRESRSGSAREASQGDIARIIRDHADAARRAADAGFDGIELHGAHGYLINQFLSRETNRRNDAWGRGAGRLNFLMAVIEAVRRAVPPTMLVGLRISPERQGLSLSESQLIVAAVKDRVDFLHLSVWDAFAGSKAQPQQTITEALCRSTDGQSLPPVISTGSVWTGSDASHVLRQGADLVGVGRAAIANPTWAADVIAAPRLYRPVRPPLTEDDLRRRCGLNEVFVYYMRRWQFVKDADGQVLPFDPHNWSGVARAG